MWNEAVLAYFQLLLVPRLRMGGAVPLGPLYAFITWARKIVPLCVTICLEVLKTTYVFIHRPVYVLCSVHATYPAHPRRLHVSPEVRIFTSSASLSTRKRSKRIFYSILRIALHCRQGHTALYGSVGDIIVIVIMLNSCLFRQFEAALLLSKMCITRWGQLHAAAVLPQ